MSSEGEKSVGMMEEVEEGREAEATETAAPVCRGSGTARRSGRSGMVRGGRSRNPPTPIVWDDSPPTSIIRGNIVDNNCQHIHRTRSKYKCPLGLNHRQNV